ncbi:MAG: C40 family peptidase [Flavobacteriales bacterium]
MAYDGGWIAENQIPLIDSSKADTVLKYAFSMMGKPYKWGGAAPSTGFDCSGLLYWAYKKVGFTIIRSSQGLAKMGVGIDSTEACKGDVILFKGTNANTTGVGHVGIVTNKKGERLTFIQCSSAKKHFGVVHTVFGGSYYVKRYLGIRRVLGIIPTDTTKHK